MSACSEVESALGVNVSRGRGEDERTCGVGVTNIKAIRTIYTYDARVLREETRDVERPDDDIKRLIGDMFETMHAAHGIGLAANQVGQGHSCLLYTSDAADERSSVDLGGRRIIKKTKQSTI